MTDKIHLDTIIELIRRKYGVDTTWYHNKDTPEPILLFETSAEIEHVVYVPKEQQEKRGRYVIINKFGYCLDQDCIYAELPCDSAVFEYESNQWVFNTAELSSSNTLIFGYPIKQDFLDAICELEQKNYPQSSGIILNTSFGEDIVPCMVDEIAYVDPQEFKMILRKHGSAVLENYNKTQYGYYPDGRNVILVIDEKSGDGLMIDYARNIHYAPGIDCYINQIKENRMKLAEKKELKLYVPLDIRLDDKQAEYMYKDELDSVNGIPYYDEIMLAIQKSMNGDGEHGLAKYFNNIQLKHKVYSLFPSVEIRNNGSTLYGVMTAQICGDLSAHELSELKDFCEGQFADGWGESFEQRDIKFGRIATIILF